VRDRPGPTPSGYVADTMVLAMFVDAGQAALLPALAAGRLFVTPSIIDSAETPPFPSQPTAEFARGAFYLQERQGNPLAAVRLHRRTAFYLDIDTSWTPAPLSAGELLQAERFVSPATWAAAEAQDPTRRIKRVSRGEAECAAVAVTRGWTFWTDDTAILDLLAILHPPQPVERISDLLIRAAHEGFLGCQEAADLYNDVFRDTLGLWTTRILVCRNGRVADQ
jgi:hypothetical protein